MRYDIVKNYLLIWSKGKIVLFLPANRNFSFTVKQCFSVWEINKCPGPQTQPSIKMYLVPRAKCHLQGTDFSGRLGVLWRDRSKRFSIRVHLQKRWCIRRCSAAFLLLGTPVGEDGEKDGVGSTGGGLQSFRGGGTGTERSTAVVLGVAPGSAAPVQSAVISRWWLGLCGYLMQRSKWLRSHLFSLDFPSLFNQNYKPSTLLTCALVYAPRCGYGFKQLCNVKCRTSRQRAQIGDAALQPNTSVPPEKSAALWASVFLDWAFERALTGSGVTASCESGRADVKGTIYRRIC